MHNDALPVRWHTVLATEDTLRGPIYTVIVVQCVSKSEIGRAHV